MSWKDYPALSERCYLETLPNGLRLRVVPKPGFAGKFAFLGVNFGSCDTQLPQSGGWQTVPDGTAHFLEHRMFCLPDCDPEAEFSRLGAETNAFTDYAMTGYYFTCTDRFDDCLRLLLRMVSTPYFPQEAMADERAVIADEIALYDDSPEDCAQELLRRCFDAFYVPSNMAFTVMGDVDAEAVSRLAREVLLPDFSPPPARPCGEAEPARAFRHRTRRTLPVSQPVFAIGFKTAPSADPLRQELTGQLAAELLLGESAALYEDLYTRGLIDADFSSGFTRVPGAAFLQAGGAGCDPEAVLEAILQAPKTSFSPERFARLKKSVRGRLLRELDGFESTCYRICEAIFAGGDCFCEFDLLDSITLSDTEALLTQTVTPECAALSVAAPEEA